MSEVDNLLQRYKEIRQRLRHPSNAVPDTGIDLKRLPTGTILRDRRPFATLTSQDNEPPPQEALPPPPIVLTFPLTFASSVHFIAREFGITGANVLSKTKNRRFSHVRHIAVHILMKHHHRATKSWIGRQFGLDHTSVIYADRKVTSMLEANPDLKEKVLSLEAKLALFDTPPASAYSQPHLGEGQEGDVPKQRIPSVD